MPGIDEVLFHPIWFEILTICCICLLLTLSHFRSHIFRSPVSTVVKPPVRLKREAQRKPSDVISIIVGCSHNCQANKSLELWQKLVESGEAERIKDLCELCELPGRYSVHDFYILIIQDYLRVNQTEGIFEVIKHMREVSGINRTYDFYASVIRMLGAYQCYPEAVRMYDELTRDHIYPRPTLLSCMVNYATEASDLQSAKRFFSELKIHSTPSIRACMIMLRIFQKENDVDAAESLLYEMAGMGAKVDHLVVNFTLGILVNHGYIERAQGVCEFFSNTLDIVSYNTIMKGYARSGRSHEALDLLRDMQRGEGNFKVKPNLITYNTLIDGLIRAERPEKALQLTHELRANDFFPDKFTCSILVKGLGMTEDPEFLSTCFEIVQMLGLPADDSQVKLQVSLFSTMLDACWKARNADLAENILTTMQVNTPRHVTTDLYGSVIAIAAITEDVPRCLRLWKTIHEKNVAPPHNVVCMLRDIFHKSESDAAQEAYTQVMELTNRPTPFSKTRRSSQYLRQQMAGQPMEAQPKRSLTRRPGNPSYEKWGSDWSAARGVWEQ